MRAFLRPEYALPGVCLVAAGVLAASELMDTFQFVPALGDPLAGQTGGERHGYALLILAALGVAATLGLLASGLASLAGAIALAGVVALIVFGTLDLPDAGSIGNFNDRVVSFAEVEAQPRLGFWLELAGALGLAVAGAWLALLTPDQRMAPARALAEHRGKPKLEPAGKRIGAAVKRARARSRRPAASRARQAKRDSSSFDASQRPPPKGAPAGLEPKPREPEK